jgi:hypothetical protein
MFLARRHDEFELCVNLISRPVYVFFIYGYALFGIISHLVYLDRQLSGLIRQNEYNFSVISEFTDITLYTTSFVVVRLCPFPKPLVIIEARYYFNSSLSLKTPFFGKSC